MIRLLTTTALFAAGLLLAPPGSFAQTSQPNAPSRAAPAGTATEALNQEDQTFVKEAGIGGMAEVELSKLAPKVGKTPTSRASPIA
jgi:predicted outer membrane protein